ncbi:hypothetical protein DL98DRAFT_598235 [Cadophora sp. DSE1049]|nr:hypothetical protein DL98DRAFT_598235 [Cadophora sp. DSE1049]
MSGKDVPYLEFFKKLKERADIVVAAQELCPFLIVDGIVEFAPKFENLKPLARELRHVLFPIRDGTIFTGTFHDNDIMYDGMIDAFSRAIDRLGKEEQTIV